MTVRDGEAGTSGNPKEWTHAQACKALEKIRNAMRRDPLLKRYLESGFWDAAWVDIVWRHDGQNKRHQADWLKEAWSALKAGRDE